MDNYYVFVGQSCSEHSWVKTEADSNPTGPPTLYYVPNGAQRARCMDALTVGL